MRKGKRDREMRDQRFQSRVEGIENLEGRV